MPSDLTLMTADVLSQAIHQKQVSCREVMASTLARIERINPRWNAIVSLREADVLLLTPKEVEYFRHGGLLQYVLRQLAARHVA